ncbi:MAG: hypothetical protein OQL09_02975 [Gammaproteobacteria bacterium]|nr:hypothetical protein [Gammaproteobacteria bacterium]
MKTKIRLMLLALVLPVFMVGCSSSSDGGSTASGALAVHNSQSMSIWYLYVKPTSDSTWSSDQLGTSVISSGTTFTLTGLVPCDTYWDFDVEYYYSNGTYAGYWTGTNRFVPCGGTYDWYPSIL